MHVGILGALEVTRDGRTVEVAGGRLRALLARLALDAGRPVTVGTLVDAVWEDALPADEQHALQSLISRLRRALGSGDAIAPAPGGYRLALDPEHVDAPRFERLAAEGAAALRAGDPEQAAATLRDALRLWRGPALADLAGRRFAVAAATPLEDSRLSALAGLAEAELALGRGAGLAAELEAAAAEHPLHERLAARLVSVLYAAGRQADALAAYERVRARLADELGAAPSPELQAAHIAVLRGDAPGPPPGAEERPARRSNLRAPVTSFVGRVRELADIRAELERSRLVTLVGPGGAGKTRLAGEAVAGWEDRVADGIWMVELAPVTDPVEVVPAILGALGIRETALLDRTGRRTAREGMDRLLDVLADREAILVLDNCEHLVATAAEVADRLLGHCPRLRILATSREPLAIAGERLAPVSPLDLPAPGATPAEALAHPAVELFADRAAAARPGFAVDADTVDAVVEVCRRLDGLPLAIELAAARLRSMPVDALAARLDDRFRLLTGGSRTALPRHRTLRAVVDWSWDLLAEPERRLARRLAVFNAGATEESAAAVCGEGDVLDGLAALVDRSLLQPVPGTSPQRYRMLETIREYGMERLGEAGELAEVRTAHARWFADLAARADAELRGPHQAEWFHRLEAERDDVVAALRWLGESGDAARALRLAVNLLWFWMLTGSAEEARTWTELALAVPGEADPHDRLLAEGVATIAAAGHSLHEGDADPARARLAELAGRLEALGDGGRQFLAIARPILPFFSGDSGLAARRLAETLEHPDPWVRAAALLLRAHLAENEGDQEHMGADLERAAEAYRELGDHWALSLTLSSQSSVRMLAGDLDGAETALAEASELVEDLAGTTATGMLALRTADIRIRRGDVAGAREAADRARESSDLGSDAAVFVIATQARIAAVAGETEEVRRLVAEADERIARMGPQRPEQGHAQAFAELMHAMLALEDGDQEGAERLLAAAHATAVGTGDMPVVAAVGVGAATAAGRAGRPEDAAELLGASAALRGADDETNPDVACLTAALRETLGDAAFTAARARGAALDRGAALARLSGAAPVGP